MQYIGIEGYTDNEYEYSDTEDTASVIISKPLSASAAEWEGGRFWGHVSNANALTGGLADHNVTAGVIDLILSKTHPLYNKVREGDIVVTVIKHKGGNKQTKIKEYQFYFGKDKSAFYYVK